MIRNKTKTKEIRGLNVAKTFCAVLSVRRTRIVSHWRSGSPVQAAHGGPVGVDAYYVCDMCESVEDRSSNTE